MGHNLCESLFSPCIQILSSNESLYDRIKSVTTIFCRETSVDRVSMFHVQDGVCSDFMIHQHSRASEGKLPGCQSTSEVWFPSDIYSGKPVHIVTAEIDEVLRRSFDDLSILSVVFLPILASNSFWGFMRLEELSSVGQWGHTDLQILKSTADAVGMAISHWEELEYHITFERLISRVSSNFAQADRDKIDTVIEDALERIGRFFEVDRVSLFQTSDEEEEIMEKTFEWSVESEDVNHMNRISVRKELPWLADRIFNGETVVMSSINGLPTDSFQEQQYFKEGGIKSVVSVPLRMGSRSTGFVEFVATKCERPWCEYEQRLLQCLGETIGGALEQSRVSESLRRSEERFSEVNRVVIGLGSSFDANAEALTSLSGRLLNATCSLYNRLEGELLCSLGQWNTPVGYEPRDNPVGHICYDVILRSEGGAFIVKNLDNSIYYETDPNVKKYDLKTYVGCPVYCESEAVGALCVVYQDNVNVTNEELKVLEIAASALSTEEKRKRSEMIISREMKERRMLLNHLNTQVWYMNDDERYGIVNSAHARFLGIEGDEIAGKELSDVFPQSSADHLRQIYRKVFDTGKVSNAEIKLHNADGELRQVSILTSPVLRDNGSVSHVVCSAEDITWRRQTEEALRSSELNFRMFFETLDSMLVVATSEGRICFANSLVQGRLRFTQNELLGMNVTDLLVFEKERKVFVSSILSGKKRNALVTLLTKDEHHVLNEGHFWLGKWSAEECIFCVFEYPTSEREAEQRFERLFQRNPLPIVLTDSERGVIIDVNDAFSEKTGYSHEESTGRPYSDLNVIVESDVGMGENNFVELCKKGVVSDLEIKFRHKDGKTGTALFFAEIIAYHGMEYVIIVMMDITDLKSAENQLSLQALVLNQIQDHVIVTDLNGVMTYMNDASANSLGRPVECFLGHSVHILGEDPMRGATQDQIIEETCRNGQWRGEVANKTIEGDEFVLDCRSCVVKDGNGRSVALCGISTDITERIHLEEERMEMERRIQQTQKLESLGVLAGGIAHDFNNLLMSVLGHADLALDTMEPTSPSREFVEQIVTASRRAADLCAQMLAYSGRGKVKIAIFAIDDLIREMAHLLRTSISKKSVLKLNGVKDTPNIKGDITQVRQVVMNLVINASEAIGEKSGVIKLVTGQKHYTLKDFKDVYFQGEPSEGTFVYIEVSDTGCGMDKDVMAHIFDPFFTTKFTGRGLGMSAVLGIVRSHKGILCIESEVGRGTTFRVLLHPSSERENQLQKPMSTSMFEGERTILLVDDEENVRSLGKKMLERIGFSVFTACNGEEAITMYKQQPGKFDLVLLDLTMPCMDGEETLLGLLECDTNVRVVMASGYSKCELEERFADKPVLDIIQKPYSMSELKEKLYPVFCDIHPNECEDDDDEFSSTERTEESDVDTRTEQEVNGQSLREEVGISTNRALTVLLVDDEPVLRELGLHQLQRLGHFVLTAKDGNEAVDVYSRALESERREDRVDVVLLDMCMPEMGGKEAFARIKELDRDARVVISSGICDNEEMSELLSNGAVCILPKPYQREDLAKAITCAVYGKSS